MIKLFAKKSLGQNFLVNPGIIAKIIVAADLSAEDTVLEIGPGTGNLTRAIVATGARVIAVEKDRRVIEDLQAEFSAAQIQIIEGDALKFNPKEYGLGEGGYKIVANLPYYITSHFLRIALEEWPQPQTLVLMVQEEVADRMMAKPPEMNLLALSVQYYAKPELVTRVSRGSFRPEPNVDSAVVQLIPQQHPLPVEKEKIFFAMIRAAFAGKRKQLLNTLPVVLSKTKEETIAILQQSGIEPTARPETLTLENWLALVNRL